MTEKEEFIYEILTMLKSKSKTEFILNILIFADFALWQQSELEEFIDCINEINEDAHDKNRIVLSYNPILCISLACLHLTSIGNSSSLFKRRCEVVSEGLLSLGSSIVGALIDESVEPIFLDQDFKNRTVLHIITYNGYA